jgi:translation initiation factor IF-2
MVKGQTLSGSLIAQATSGAGAVESTAAGAALTATATGLAGLISGKKIQAALSLTATADASGIATSQREIIYVYADDRKAVVEATNRKSYIEKFSNNVVVTYEVRKVSVAASRKFTVND